MSELHQAAAVGDVKTMEDILRNNKCDPNGKDIDWSSKTPLHWAAAGGHTEAVQLLLAHGARACLETELGWTAAHFAAESGRLSVLRQLHIHHAPVDRPDHFGDTPARIAQIYGHTECFLFLQRAEEECQAYRKMADQKGQSLDDVDTTWMDSSKENCDRVKGT